MGKYDDIINTDYSKWKEQQRDIRRPYMSSRDRAAQFAPFAALTGYDEIIRETERYTENEVIVDEDEKRVINELLVELKDKTDFYSNDNFSFIIEYFVPDEKKSGGRYERIKLELKDIKKIDDFERKIKLKDKREIDIDRIIKIEKESKVD